MHKTAYNGTAPVLIFEECTIILSIVHFLTQMHVFFTKLGYGFVEAFEPAERLAIKFTYYLLSNTFL